MSNQQVQPLKLKARDVEDIQVISAVLQDSIVPICDMAYRPEDKEFIMVVQRFCREKHGEEGAAPCFERVRCAVRVRGVTGSQLQGIDQGNPEGMLDLLAIMPEDEKLQFIFAGGGKIRLNLADWTLIIEDFGEPWPTQCCPAHPGETASA